LISFLEWRSSRGGDFSRSASVHGGDFQGVLKFRNDDERDRARTMGITDENKVYRLDELAYGNVMFIATGITNGSYLSGVRYFGGGAYTIVGNALRDRNGA